VSFGLETSSLKASLLNAFGRKKRLHLSDVSICGEPIQHALAAREEDDATLAVDEWSSSERKNKTIQTQSRHLTSLQWWHRTYAWPTRKERSERGIRFLNP